MFHVISNLCCFFLLSPLTYGGKTEYYEYRSKNLEIPPTFGTMNPFPWNKITVPTLLQIDEDKYLSNYESFKIFVYVLLSIIFAILVYWSFRHCTKACSNQQRPRNIVGRRYSYTPVSRQPGRRSQRERGHNTGRRNQIMTLILNLETRNEDSPLAIQTSEKPPDYFAVVRNDFSAKEAVFLDPKPQDTVETPPPAYDESLWNKPNTSKESHVK